MSASEKKARRLADAHEKAKGRVVELTAQAAAAENFEDPADVKKLLAARAAVEAAKQERDMLAVALGGAEKAHAVAVAEEAAEQAKARHEKLRAQAAAVGKDFEEALVPVCRLAGQFVLLAGSLGNNTGLDRGIEDFCRGASHVACAGAERTAAVQIALSVPIMLVPNP